LQNLTPQQVGAFLLQWRASQQVWSIPRLE
jgi:hypothetical protein